MTARVFVDSNVLGYARDPRDTAKQTCASEWIKLLWSERRGHLSTQVLSEYYAVVTGKFAPPVPANDAWDDVQFFMAWNPQSLDSDLLVLARDIEQRYRLDWWDALIVAGAQAQGCAMLLTEGLQDGADFGGVIVRNPFTLKIAEEHSAYPAAPKVVSRHRGRGRPRRSAKRAEAAG